MTKVVNVLSVTGRKGVSKADRIAVEEPLEIRLNGPGIAARPISITMRTPGCDYELAVGFLWGEGILRSIEQLTTDRELICDTSNVVSISVHGIDRNDVEKLSRNFNTTSSCGICGKASLDLIKQSTSYSFSDKVLCVDSDIFHGLQTTVRESQLAFDQTGGLHAAALFDSNGNMLRIREDVGRHNAVDKIVGAEILDGSLPLYDRVLFLSGRASFELVQKAAMAGIPVVASVGAPSSLALELAEELRMTLIGFMRDSHFNIYTGAHRVVL